ncbi:MAG: hypothetical protein HKN30_03750 [Sulfitobacter sp.]|nr:hypothetical protein [Sulfitobacter sp.]
MRLVLFLLILPMTALAAEFPLLKDDRVLSRDEVSALTQRDVVEFYEGGQSRYAADGRYNYTYQSGGTAFGDYEIGSDGVICIAFDNGRDRCDRFVHSHGRIVMITEGGDRYPIRPAR